MEEKISQFSELRECEKSLKPEWGLMSRSSLSHVYTLLGAVVFCRFYRIHLGKTQVVMNITFSLSLLIIPFCKQQSGKINHGEGSLTLHI